MFCRNCGLPLPEDAGLRNKVIIAAAPEKHYVTSAAEQGKTTKRDYRIWVDFLINLFYLKTIYDNTITRMEKEPLYGAYYP